MTPHLQNCWLTPARPAAPDSSSANVSRGLTTGTDSKPDFYNNLAQAQLAGRNAVLPGVSRQMAG
ncbi:hypothetical protein Mkiyose1665_24440 [Mycobacterium kiyosense]|uniref:Uncharacterized protein n=1 Tax=Mycobacterium kiyosense TaxID=2871094 RepID=A0A9P3Q517_9MYCO|nr:hypothetical protein MKCMC460_48350 [Mycobacterium sp. 20KCMC460]GLB81809.1 hypothetical protein SRL2020028_10650 [Mycobacterium kiyosense]GLB90327.1 hypothetical protein SRL2020130_31440 [Mycobacterium kiyosense]GLB96084.1 hypothetical protein SRL2020226_28600 [Mycobacterium kiyosense]GLC02095.1 hypothetical protein SRL2020400_26860 [Mycobacterium kiyosense]